MHSAHMHPNVLVRARALASKFTSRGRLQAATLRSART